MSQPKLKRWDQGRDEVEELINEGKLQRVVASREHADRLMRQASNHLTSSGQVAYNDPEGAYALLYTAARKAFVAVLEVQGLRATSTGGHVVLVDTLRAQIDPPLGAKINIFNRLRRARHGNEYPPTSEPELTQEEVLQDLDKAKEIVQTALTLLEQMPIF